MPYWPFHDDCEILISTTFIWLFAYNGMIYKIMSYTIVFDLKKCQVPSRSAEICSPAFIVKGSIIED